MKGKARPPCWARPVQAWEEGMERPGWVGPARKPNKSQGGVGREKEKAFLFLQKEKRVFTISI